VGCLRARARWRQIQWITTRIRRRRKARVFRGFPACG